MKMRYLTKWHPQVFCIFILMVCSSAQKSEKILEPFLPYLNQALSIWDGYDELTDVLNSTSELDESQYTAGLILRFDLISKNFMYHYNDILRTLTEMKKHEELTFYMEEFIQVLHFIEKDFQALVTAIKIKNFTYQHVRRPIRKILDDMPYNLLTLIDSIEIVRNSNIFEFSSDSDLKAKLGCLTQTSTQQKLYSIYQIALTMRIKGLLSLIYAHQLEVENDPSTRRSAVLIEIAAYFLRTKELIDSIYAGIGLDEVTGDIWMCDPKQPEEGKTYERFGRAFQKYLFNLKNLQSNIADSSDNFNCDTSCESLGSHSHNEKANHFMHNDIPSNRCQGGFLSNCKTIKEDKIDICKAEANQTERYSYMKIGNAVYGNQSYCRTKPITISRPEPGLWNRLFGSTCYYCMCTCEYGPNEAANWDELQRLDTDRYIDLHPVTADEGYVVTGIRLKKVPETHTFHLEIKQAKLLARGRVSEAHWKITPTYYPVTPKNPYDPKSPMKYKDNVDYHKVTYNLTAAYLVNLVASRDNQVVTGVKFQTKLNNKNGKVYLWLAVQFSDVDFPSGKVNGNEEWQPEISEEFLIYSKPVKVDGLGLPTQFNGQNEKITAVEKSSYSIEFANSGLKDDVGQSVLPFIDIQSVDTIPPVPLVGVSLYHRGVNGSGGYLGLKARIFNLRHYLPDTGFLIDKRQKLITENENNF